MVTILTRILCNWIMIVRGLLPATEIIEFEKFCKGQQAISSSELHHSQSEQKAYSIPFIRNASLVCHNTFCTTLLDASPFSTNRFYSRPGHFEIMPKSKLNAKFKIPSLRMIQSFAPR